MNKIKIGDRVIGNGYSTFVIAELSCNHSNDFDVAVATIHKMKAAGADCVKLQTSKPDAITINSNKSDFVIKGDTLWDGRTLYDLYSQTHTPWEWHLPLKKLVEGLGMVFFSSPFDHEAVEFLDELGVPAYKIASFEITDVPLIKHAASKGKPMIISTGIATESDISDAIDACISVGNDQIVLLKCTSAYPTPLEEVHLNSITTIKQKFNCMVGLSDHTIGYLVPVGAVALGATIIEKHFILDKEIGGPDAAFSMEPGEFGEMVSRIRELEKALGSKDILISDKVEKNRQFARSLYVVEDLKKGEVFTSDNVKSIRPGHGMAPKYSPEIIGKKARIDIERGTPMSENLIDYSNDELF